MKKIRNLIYIFVLAIGISGCADRPEEVKELLLTKETAEVKNEADGGEEILLEENTKSQNEEIDMIYVQVSGAVNNPGVYELPSGSRVFQALELAGGMTEKAEEKSLNQAQTLEDGQMIWATKEELQTLPGIGEAKALSILAWREEHGGFAQIEDIMKIEGIKEGVFSKIKDSVKVQ